MDRRDLGNGSFALISESLESAGFLAAFTERTGGVSSSPFNTLNLGARTEDSPARVLQNRRRLTASLNVPPFAVGEQVHGAGLARLGEDRSAAGFDDPGSAIEEVDALSVTRPNLPVAVLVADCLPIALASPLERKLVVVHAGWRGLAAGILIRAVREFDRSSDTLVSIGPAIGPCHYEVGDDVARAVASASGDGAVTERREGRLYLDLWRTAERSLRATGVRTIELSELCTACLPGRFFSHRRDGTTGRQALISMIM